VPEGVLFRGGPDQKVRQELLERFNLHTVLSLPAGCFLPYTGVKTNVIFFDRPKTDLNPGEWATQSVWFYELTNDGFELKSTRKPLEGNQLPDFIKRQNQFEFSENSWSETIENLAENKYELSVKNPNIEDHYEHKPAFELVQAIKEKEIRVLDLLEELESILEIQK
jgi:type I restriction enzyme M protein